MSSLYLVVCRLLALLVLLARGDRSKELEILVLRHELGIPWGAETRSGGELVFVDEAAEEVAPAQGR